LLDTGALIAGRYEIVAPLASGGSGLIYAATDRTTEKRVAIKVLGQHVLHERAAREKLRLEAIVAGRVESENIVQVWDAGVDSQTGLPFLVMELLKGNDLQHWVEQQGRLDATMAVEFLRQVALGLDKAHSWKDSEQRPAPIVHRDLKPENLYLTHRDDGSPLIKILDFGLAKVLSNSATLSNEIRGTPLYMAPEQLSQAPVTPATDIWAIGLIAFFLLTGKCYWKSGQSGNAVLPAVLKEVGDGPTATPRARLVEFGVDATLPAAFDEWFLRCVNVEPRRRFPTAGEAVRALALALGETRLAAPVPEPKRRRHWALPLMVVLAIAGVIATTVRVAMKHSTRPATPNTPTQPSADALTSTPQASDARIDTATTSAPGPVAQSNVAPPPRASLAATVDSPRTTSTKTHGPPKPTASLPVTPALATRNPAALSSAAPAPSATGVPPPPRTYRDPADHR
jgi:eukaryotic-like serine/threonine-protein kinase